MPVLPLINLPDQKSDIFRTLGETVGSVATKGYDNQLIGNILRDVDVSDPDSVQEILSKTPANLRPQISSILKEQLQLRNASEQGNQQKQEFESIQKLNKLKIQEIEQQKNQEFSAMVNNKLKTADDMTKEAFNDLSKKYSEEVDPNIKYKKTFKEYTSQLQPVQRLVDKVNKVSSFRKGFVGMKSSDLNALSSNIQKLKKDGIDERIIKSALDPKKTGINEKDFDAIMMPNYQQVKKISDSIKPQKRQQVPGQAGVVGTMSVKMSEAQTNKAVSLLSKAIGKGGSLDFLYSELLDKGYSDEIANEMIRDASITTELTTAQQVQLNNLVEKRRALLGRIFGSN